MLIELNISNFAIIDQLRLELAPGLNVLTGETGAGKSIIIDAVSLLLGGRAQTEFIRAGDDQAWIEGIFNPSEATRQALAPLLEEFGLEEEDELIMAREINREGRNICRANGRAVTLTVLRRLGEHLVDIHGQGEHLSLLRPREHINLLDRFGQLAESRQGVAESVSQLRGVQRELSTLRQDERELARRVDLLEYQVEEISAAKLEPGEEKGLIEERDRLANAERLMTLADAAYRALYDGDERHPAATDLVGEVTQQLTKIQELDPSLEDTKRQTEEIAYQVEELARSLRDYRDGIEYDPQRLREVEERLNLIHELKRKYGDSIEEVLEFAEEAAQELRNITHSEERIEELEEREGELLADLGDRVVELSAARREAAEELTDAVEKELTELNMSDARLDVAIEWKEKGDGVPIDGKRYAFDTTGVDRIEFLISPNVGEPLRPLAKIASGGETSRLMLAMKSVLSAVDRIPTLIFDEIDAGIGGRAGEVVGHKLSGLTSEHQVLCVTHLPQIASFADSHYVVRKEVVEGRTITGAQPVGGEERVEELSQMLGSTSELTREKARELLAQRSQERRSASPDREEAGLHPVRES